MLSEKYLNTTYLICYYFRKRNAIRIIYLLCINVKKVERLQPNNKCKKQKQLSLVFDGNKICHLKSNLWWNSLHFKKKKNDETSLLNVHT